MKMSVIGYLFNFTFTKLAGFLSFNTIFWPIIQLQVIIQKLVLATWCSGNLELSGYGLVLNVTSSRGTILHVQKAMFAGRVMLIGRSLTVRGSALLLFRSANGNLSAKAIPESCSTVASRHEHVACDPLCLLEHVLISQTVDWQLRVKSLQEL